MPQNTDEARWGALWLRWACAPNWSFKTLALSSPSIRVIEKRLRLADAQITDPDEQLKLALKHQNIMIKAGAGMGLKPHEFFR